MRLSIWVSLWGEDKANFKICNLATNFNLLPLSSTFLQKTAPSNFLKSL
jgi:hypothetical protein